MKQLVISVHGIRTFGDWQGRLETLLKGQVKDRELTVTSYKFGYFSVAAFIIPLFRWLVVRRFRKFLVAACAGQAWDRVDLVGHSFGTHIVAWALYGIPASKRPPVHTIILAGSVLKNYFPWQMLIGHPVKRVINDCGTKDGVLAFSQVLVLFTGMAGRLGFSGGTGDNFRNRFFAYDHSGYFLSEGQPDDAFMRKYWVPLLLSDDPPILVDERRATALGGIWLTLLNNAEPIKLAIYVALVVLPALWVYGLYRQAEAARKEAQANFEATDGLLSGLFEVVSKNVQPTAQLKTAEGLLKSTEAIIGRLPPASRDDPRIRLQHARAYIVMAELKWEGGDISGIHALAEQAIGILKPLAPNASSNPEALHLLARSTGLDALFHANNRQQPNPQEALRLYTEALGQLKQLETAFDSAGSPERDRDWLLSLARMQRDVGDLLLTAAFGKVDEAERSYNASVGTFKKLNGLWPDWRDIDYEQAWAENKYGDVLWRKGDANALDQFQRAAKRISDLGEPELWQHLGWRHSLALVQNNVGSVLRSKGRYEEALEAFEGAETELNKLSERDPGHSSWGATLAWTYDNIGDTKVRWARKQGQEELLAGARERLVSALTTRDRLASDAPSNLRWRIDVQISRANLSAYDGALKELRKDFANAGYDFESAARHNAVNVADERREPMALRTIEFLQSAALDFRQAGNTTAADARLAESIKLTRDQIATAINRKVFEDKLTELNSLFDRPR